MPAKSLPELYVVYFLIFAATMSCGKMEHKFTNHLESESSLYLQQHAHNPVNWYPWSDEAWEKAKQENKLVLISIGYSSCHWCHVMEHESFEDTAVARIMNENFICIKVDREERPDVDQIYMTAVQIMTGGGGWPLNCFTLPDGRPIYGGTYFPNANWKDVLGKLNDFYKENPEKANEYADELTKGINHPEIIAGSDTLKYDFASLQNAVDSWKKYLDNTEGGPSRTPKFPLPGNYDFLLRYAITFNDTTLLSHVNLTLKKMAYGGIYDQLAGGFSRYSVDSLWKAPHFEKMLYDNSQLVSLYSEAFKVTKNILYKNIVEETLQFLKEDMSDCKGSYYAAIDADSEGEEGKYYVWTREEIAKTDFGSIGNIKGSDVFSDYFNINQSGLWEKNTYILLRREDDNVIAKKYNLSEEELKTFIDNSRKKLLAVRKNRIAPAIDKKIITSWNALHVSALCKAYEAFGNEDYRDEAIKCASNILKCAVSEKNTLIHVAGKKENTEGFLDDYAFTISAFIDLYQVTFDESWLQHAKRLTDQAITNYFDETDKFFWYTSKSSKQLIARKKEITDNVIPASNSQMAKVLFILSDYFEEKNYMNISNSMLQNMKANISNYPSSYSNWADLAIDNITPFREIVISGNDAEKFRKELTTNYLPGVLLAGSDEENNSLSLLQNRFSEGKTLIYVCSGHTCKLPVENVQNALELLKNNAENNSASAERLR